jgi:hypothetical protein
MAANRRIRHAKNPEQYRKYDRDRYQTDPRAKMLAAAKRRAKEKRLPFDITISDILIPDYCPLLGIKLKISSGKMTDNSPSLDRIRNNAGYVRGNIMIVSYAANRSKGSLGSADLLKLAINLQKLERKIPEWLAVEKGLV